jgi:predicted  nucleic acid-binding Zn-ribbon protein
MLSALIVLLAGNALAKQQTDTAANPIRKVVTMLQSMQKKVTAEGEKEKELFDKFMCYCKHGDEALAKSISAAEAKVPAVTSDIEEAESQVKQLKEDLKSHQTDRAAAKSAMAEATAIREKEAATFAAEKAEFDANIAAVSKATAAVEKGMSGSFLQTSAAQVLKKLVLAQDNGLVDYDREELTSFLSGSSSQEYAPSSGQITGILKQMEDTMTSSLNQATADETSSIKSYEGLMAAKTKEVAALTASIEDKSVRLGETQVAIVEMKEDLDDTSKGLLDDRKFLGDLSKNCALKTKEHEENMKLRSQELLALADTIKILNDDDALELFKKTLPASASFMQVVDQRQEALATIRAAQHGARVKHPELNFLVLALQGKKVDFGKVISMIDEMIATLKVEQQDDADKKEYCEMQFDTSDDKKKGLERSVSNLERSIAKAKEAIATLAEEIKALEEGIAALDKSVAEATEQRKEENKDYTELMASDAAAKELLGFAKNRLNKFYSPKLYKAPPKTDVTVLADVSMHTAGNVAPPPPPATAAAFSKKSEESNGVIAMIDLMIGDLTKEMTQAETAEKDAQADYEQAMADSAEKRAADTKTLTDKTKAKADTTADMEASTEEKAATTKTLMATLEYIQSLHAECDWLLQYYEVRKEARTGEIDSLKNAKAVLSGADFSFAQVDRRHLRGAA